MNAIMAIAAGGAVGALLRHFFNNTVTALLGTDFPWGIMLANILGSFVMGALVGLFAHIAEPPHALKLFLTVGMLGAFTTFSAFSLDAALLIERGAYVAAASYIAGSVALSIAGLFGGMVLVRGFAG